MVSITTLQFANFALLIPILPDFDAYFYENTRKYKSKDNGTEWIKSQKEIKMLQGQTAGMILLKTYCYVYCWIG